MGWLVGKAHCQKESLPVEICTWSPGCLLLMSYNLGSDTWGQTEKDTETLSQLTCIQLWKLESSAGSPTGAPVHSRLLLPKTPHFPLPGPLKSCTHQLCKFGVL